MINVEQFIKLANPREREGTYVPGEQSSFKGKSLLLKPVDNYLTHLSTHFSAMAAAWEGSWEGDPGKLLGGGRVSPGAKRRAQKDRNKGGKYEFADWDRCRIKPTDSTYGQWLY